MRRLAMGMLMVLMLAGCGLPLPGKPDVTPVPLPADRLVLSVRGSSPMAPPLYLALTGVGLAVYGDGRVVRFPDNTRFGLTPPPYVVATAGPDAAARLAAEAEASGLFAEGVDYGYPDATDLGATTVTLHGASGPRQVVVVGPDESFDSDVSFGQRRLRRELRALLDRARELRGDAQLLDYQVERVAVREMRPQSGPGGQTPAAVPTWPGPDPATFLAPTDKGVGFDACGELTGDPAHTLYTQARNNPGQVWVVGSEKRVLAVTPVLPGADGCET